VKERDRCKGKTKNDTKEKLKGRDTAMERGDTETKFRK